MKHATPKTLIDGGTHLTHLNKTHNFFGLITDAAITATYYSLSHSLAFSHLIDSFLDLT